MIKLLAVIIIVALVFWASSFLIAKGRVQKNTHDAVKKNTHKLNKFTAHSYRIADDLQMADIADPTKMEDIHKRLERSVSIKANFFERIRSKANYALPTLSTNSLITVYVASSLMIALAIIIFIGVTQYIVALLIGFFAGYMLLNTYLNYSYNKKISLFLDNLIYALDIIARGVRSGLMLNDCFQLISKESHPSVAEQFKIILQDLRIGLPVDQVMQRFAKRLPLKEVRFFTLIIMVQAKTGGNLAEVITNLSNVLRQRKSILMRIQTLSQEAKSSAAILMALPFFVIGVLMVIGQGYMDIMFETTIGNMILGGGLCWMSIGIYIMRKMINFYR